MLNKVATIFRPPDLRRKILFTLGLIVLYRVGTIMQIPGIDTEALDILKSTAKSQGIIGFLNLFSGGALGNFAVFALGVMPYVTAGIVMQLLSASSRRIEAIADSGPAGQRTINQWTRYLAVALATFQAIGVTWVLSSGRGGGNIAAGVVLLPDLFPRMLIVVPTLVGGFILLMWFGELITERGIGNGMSILIFTSVVSGLPSSYYSVWKSDPLYVFAGLTAVTVIALLAVVRVDLAQRRIPVQFPRAGGGRGAVSTGARSSFIPIKVNNGGVTPVIFASSVLAIPLLIAGFVGYGRTADRGFRSWFTRNVEAHLAQGAVSYVVMYAALVFAFAFFYSTIAFDPVKQGKQIGSQGGSIPGLRPGLPTIKFLAKVLNRLTFFGGAFIALIAILPYLVLWGTDTGSFPFAGTTILIAVGVALESVRQIDADLMQRNYSGFIKSR